MCKGTGLRALGFLQRPRAWALCSPSSGLLHGPVRGPQTHYKGLKLPTVNYNSGAKLGGL